MREACRLAKQLAEEMLANPPDLSTEQPQPATGKGGPPVWPCRADSTLRETILNRILSHKCWTFSCDSSFEITVIIRGSSILIAGKKKKSQSNISSFASTTLAKAAFLCTVLLEETECHHLAYRVGMFGLEMPRPPASSKALEVCVMGLFNFKGTEILLWRFFWKGATTGMTHHFTVWGHTYGVMHVTTCTWG